MCSMGWGEQLQLMLVLSNIYNYTLLCFLFINFYSLCSVTSYYNLGVNAIGGFIQRSMIKRDILKRYFRLA